jgi:hypothetical protein
MEKSPNLVTLPTTELHNDSLTVAWVLCSATHKTAAELQKNAFLHTLKFPQIPQEQTPKNKTAKNLKSTLLQSKFGENQSPPPPPVFRVCFLSSGIPRQLDQGPFHQIGKAAEPGLPDFS